MAFVNMKTFVAIFMSTDGETPQQIFGPEYVPLAKRALALSGNTEVLLYKLYGTAKSELSVEKTP